MTVLQNVSRETLSDLKEYESLIAKWSPSVNLVAKSTLNDIWNRHIKDSAKLFSLLPSETNRILDMGSGGGLPGVVLAIMAKEKLPGAVFTLMESDQRKAAFLRAASIQLALGLDVVTDRIETAIPNNADVVTARALAPLPKLFSFVNRHLVAGGVALLSKGRNHAEEIHAARDLWRFDVDVEPDLVEEGSVVLKVTNLTESTANES